MISGVAIPKLWLLMSRPPSIKASIVAKKFGVSPKDFVAICNNKLMISIYSTQSYIQKTDMPRIVEYFTSCSSVETGGVVSKKWPGIGSYEQALDDCDWAFKSNFLKSSEILRTKISNIRSSGRFACIAKVQILGEFWAVRLLTRAQPNLAERYEQVRSLSSRYPNNFLEVMYLVDEIRIDEEGDMYPVVLIKWSDGVPLRKYLIDLCSANEIDKIRALREAFKHLQSLLGAGGIAHGDLSVDNVLVSGGSDDPQLILLDYDSLWTEKIKDVLCAVSNQGPMQHPLRSNPIGRNADEMAFLIFDAVLAFLEASPQHGVDDFAYDSSFIISAEELTIGTSDIAKSIHLIAPSEANAVKTRYLGPYEFPISEISVRDYCYENRVSLVAVLKKATNLWPEEVFDSRYMLNCYQSNQLSRSIALSI